MTSMIGSLGGLAPDSPAAFMYRLQQLERRMDQIASARSLEAATIGAGGLTIRGGELVLEDDSGNTLATLDANGLTIAAAGRIAISGDSQFGGPVVPAVANKEVTGTPLYTTSSEDYAAVSIPVPPGCTSAMVHCTVSMSVRGTTSGGSSFSVAAKIGSSVSQSVSGQAAVNGLASASAAQAWSGAVSGTVTAALTGLVQSSSTLSWGLAQVAVTCLFLR